MAWTHLGNTHSLWVQGVSFRSERSVINWYLVTVSCSKGRLALKPGLKETSYLCPSGEVEQGKQSFSTLQSNHNYTSS